MGPIAGIGDSLVVGTLIPVLLGIALGLSKGGNIAWLLFVLLWNHTFLPRLEALKSNTQRFACVLEKNKSSDHNTNDGMLWLTFSLKFSFYQPS